MHPTTTESICILFVGLDREIFGNCISKAYADMTTVLLARRRRYFLHAYRYFNSHYNGEADILALLVRLSRKKPNIADGNFLLLVKYIMKEERARQASSTLGKLVDLL